MPLQLTLTSGAGSAAHLTVDALSSVRVQHLSWKSSSRENPVSVLVPASETHRQPGPGLCFTSVTRGRLAPPPLQLVALAALGADVAVGAQLTISHAGQAHEVTTPVRVVATRAVGPTATLVQETLLSAFI